MQIGFYHADLDADLDAHSRALGDYQHFRASRALLTVMLRADVLHFVEQTCLGFTRCNTAATATGRETGMETTPSTDAIEAQHDQMEASAEDDAWMRRALDLADAAVQNGEVPVGAVFVVDGKEVARGVNETNAAMDATRHAELVAVDAALAARREVDWARATLYVTCEPCIMCASALAQLGLKKCFFGCRNEKFGGCGSILSLHERAFPCVGGLRKEEAVGLFRKFYDRDNAKVPATRRGDTRKRKARVGP